MPWAWSEELLGPTRPFPQVLRVMCEAYLGYRGYLVVHLAQDPFSHVSCLSLPRYQYVPRLRRHIFDPSRTVICGSLRFDSEAQQVRGIHSESRERREGAHSFLESQSSRKKVSLQYFRR